LPPPGPQAGRVSVRRAAPVLVLLALTGQPAHADRVSALLARLGSPDAQTRKSGLEELRALDPKKLGDAEAEELLRAATRTWPSDSDPEGPDTAVGLVQAAGARPGHVPVVGQIFPGLPASARSAALRLLAEVGSEEAVTAMVRLIRAYAATLELEESTFQPLAEKPQHGPILFPALFAPLQRPRLTAAVASLALTYAEEQAVSDEVLVAATPRISRALGRLRATLDRLRPAAPPDDAWRWEGDYAQARSDAEYLVDLLGHCGPDAVPALEPVLRIDDPRLVYFAIESLLRLGQKVPAARVAFVASEPGVRGFLHQTLTQNQSLALMPEKYRTQAALAEADMVRWLSHPSELGRPPHEIQLMKFVDVDGQDEEGPVTLFLYRFRTQPSHWVTKDGWMAGLAGGFPRREQPTTSSSGLTFSKFEPWASRTPTGHIRELAGVVHKMRKQRAAKK
jgi:hypothetical protein